MITSMSEETYATTEAAADLAAAEPGADHPLPDQAGPAATTADEQQPDAEPAAEFAHVRWEAGFWGRSTGHVERLELTPLIRGAIASHKLTVVDAPPPCCATTLPAAALPAPAEDVDEALPRRRRRREE